MPFAIRPSRRFPVHYSVTYNAGQFVKLPLAYCSGFWSLITLLVLSSVPAYAEWVAVEKNYLVPGLRTVYVDPDTIRREGNLVTMWQLIDFKWMQGNQGIRPLGFGPHRFFLRRPTSNSTARKRAFGCWHSRSSQVVWEPVYRLMDT